MTEQPRKHMTGQTAARLLAEILKWRLEPWTPVTQVKAIRYDIDQISGGVRECLPFGLDNVIEAVDSDGAAGVTNYESIDKWLRYWNPWMSYWADLPSIYRAQPGAAFLEALDSNPVFANVPNWDNEDKTAWDEFTTELRLVHRTVANATGHQPRSRGLCPKCRKGTLLQHPDARGYDDIAICTNRECQASIDYSQEETTASIRAIMRQYNGQDLYLNIKQIRTIWPKEALKKGTLHKWVREGHVQKQGDLYRLADINQRKGAA